MPARTLDDHLSADTAMAKIATHAAHLQRLQSIFSAIIPAALSRACRVANYKLEVLIVHAENGAVATKLRQLAPSLSSSLRQRGEKVTEIRIKVQPLDAALHATIPIKTSKLGINGQAQIAQLVTDLPDGPLREALRRFMHNTTKPTQT